MNKLHLAISEIHHNEKPISGGATTNTLYNRDVTLTELVYYIENGCGFSNPFHIKKSKDNCEPTNLIVIDIDKVDIDMNTIKQSIKGIIYYPTFSDNDIKHSYRVIVKTDKFINTREDYRKYANILIYMLKDKGIDVDPCCNQMDRLYYGTKYKCDVYDVDYNYSLQELEEMGLFYDIKDEPNKSIPTTNKLLKSKENEVKNDFIKEFMKGVPFNILEKKYWRGYNIVEKPFIDWKEDEICREIPDYIEIKRRWKDKEIIKYNIGENRKAKLYGCLCIKKIIKPDMNFDEMLMNAIYDINHYFVNTDNKLNNEWLYGTVKNICETDVKYMIENLKEKMKARTKLNMQLIYEQGLTWQSVIQTNKRRKNEKKVIEGFDSSLNLKDNYKRFMGRGEKLSYDCYKDICKCLDLTYKGKHKKTKN